MAPHGEPIVGGRHHTVAMPLDLVLPLECGGCGAPSTRWCDACAHALEVRADHPVLITPRLDPGVPVFSLGRHAGVRRAAIIAVKEHGRSELARPLGAALGVGLRHLVAWGIVETPVTLVPGPTRRSAARRRGGDPVTRMAQSAPPAGAIVVQALRMRAFTRDSVGLSAGARQANIAGRVRVRKRVSGEVVLIDDVVTTGATACESVRVLQTSGARVAAVLAVAYA
jgi:predicted amidophosphoribosyltransferase